MARHKPAFDADPSSLGFKTVRNNPEIWCRIPAKAGIQPFAENRTPACAEKMDDASAKLEDALHI